MCHKKFEFSCGFTDSVNQPTKTHQKAKLQTTNQEKKSDCAKNSNFCTPVKGTITFLSRPIHFIQVSSVGMILRRVQEDRCHMSWNALKVIFCHLSQITFGKMMYSVITALIAVKLLRCFAH